MQSYQLTNAMFTAGVSQPDLERAGLRNEESNAVMYGGDITSEMAIVTLLAIIEKLSERLQYLESKP